MRVAVISDIHSNLHALEAVLGTWTREGPDELWCLGDVVGYGPARTSASTWCGSASAICLCGNHDLAVARARSTSADFTGDAGAAARWTRGVLAPAQPSGCASSRPAANASGVELFHGSPRDPIWDYVLDDAGRPDAACSSRGAARARRAQPRRAGARLGRRRARRRPGARRRPSSTLAGGSWLLNPGSVGQPRDGDPRAAWLLIDARRRRERVPRASLRRSSSPRPTIRAAGLPTRSPPGSARGI